MNLLVDTHALIWFLDGNTDLSDKARVSIENNSYLKIISVASIWELAIKISLKKFTFQYGFNNLLKLIQENGFEILPITFEHSMRVSALEFFHRDPFDRMLIAQSLVNDLTIVTHDKNIAKYPVKTLW